jgi:uncharacterized RDD family membrane protein YckC
MRFFNRFTLQTPESVELEFNLAGIGERTYALIVDYIFLGSMLIFCLVAGGFLSFSLRSFIKNFSDPKNISLWLIAIQIFILFVIYVGYFIFFEVLWQGQTPGKRWAKIRVIQDNGRPIKLQQAILRALFRPIDDIFFIGAFLIMLGKREKRLGDWVAGTVVIQEGKAISSATFPMSQAAKALAKQLQSEADPSLLLPEDFAVVREYLQRRQEMLPQARNELSRKLAARIKDIIALENISPSVTPNLFLEAVYLAYQQQKNFEF